MKSHQLIIAELFPLGVLELDFAATVGKTRPTDTVLFNVPAEYLLVYRAMYHLRRETKSKMEQFMSEAVTGIVAELVKEVMRGNAPTEIDPMSRIPRTWENVNIFWKVEMADMLADWFWLLTRRFFLTAVDREDIPTPPQRGIGIRWDEGLNAVVCIPLTEEDK